MHDSSPLSFTILFEDDYFVVAEKPPGLPSQPTLDKRRPDFFSALKKQLLEREAPVNYLALHHRLDRDTSGLMIFAKTKEANTPLADLFKDHRIQKTYLALTKKTQKCPETWEVNNHLQEKWDNKLKKTRMISTLSGGDRAHTLFEKLQTFHLGLLIQAQPQTGRMHQIRVHLAERGLGIFGDDIYPSPQEPKAPRLMLHAHRLEFIHPFTQENLSIECPLPQDMRDFIAEELSPVT